MKIAAYTCALNEEKFAYRWASAARDADQLLVIDTGSTDRTVEALLDLGVETRSAIIKPWRFDDAKNVALFSLDPDIDIAVQVDMDEVLTPGWRARLEAAWTPDTTRLNYLYVWSWLSEGHPDSIYYADKISGRYTHRWRGPAHEILHATVPEVISNCDSVLIEHHPDANKSRGDYLQLLRLAVEEDPLNDRCAHYYARELFFHQNYPEAIQQFQRHLSLPTARWAPERAASLRYMAKCHENTGDDSFAYKAYMLATLEDMLSKEACVDLANFLLKRGAWAGVVYFCTKAVNISADASHYISERYAREEGPFDLASVALYQMGQWRAASEFAKRALAYNPSDVRLQENVRMTEHAA
jgi:tetratricopeptide (TPR) repeat protein